MSALNKRPVRKVVSVQDLSCYGQCSLTVALPILSAYGLETAVLPSALLSTHTSGFTGYTCLDLTEELGSIVRHWRQEGLVFDALCTGYIGDVRQFDLILSLQQTLLREGGLLIADPAMADDGRLYPALNRDIVLGMRELVRHAQVVMPNLTEASLLLDLPYQEQYSQAELQSLLRGLADLGPELSVLTGVSHPDGRIGAMAYRRPTGEFTEAYTLRVPRHYHGTGDVFAAVLTGELLGGRETQPALEAACDFVVQSILETLEDRDHGYGVRFERVLRRKMFPDFT